MPVVNGRLICCTCGSDLGSADDPFRDPDCLTCIEAELTQELEPDAPNGDWEPDREYAAGYAYACGYVD